MSSGVIWREAGQVGPATIPATLTCRTGEDILFSVGHKDSLRAKVRVVLLIVMRSSGGFFEKETYNYLLVRFLDRMPRSCFWHCDLCTNISCVMSRIPLV